MLKTFSITGMRNGLHYTFHRDISVRLAEVGTAKLKVASVYPDYIQALFDLDIVLIKVRKSAYTEHLALLDSSRDRILSSFDRIISGALLHYSPEVVDAAKNISILRKSYGNIGRKPYNEQSSATDNLLADLKSDKYKNDVALTRTRDLVDELGSVNQQFKELVAVRDEERRTGMTEDTRVARARVDDAYHKICNVISANAAIDKDDDIEHFIGIHNVIVDRCKNEMARSKPRNKKETETCEQCETVG